MQPFFDFPFNIKNGHLPNVRRTERYSFKVFVVAHLSWYLLVQTQSAPRGFIVFESANLLWGQCLSETKTFAKLGFFRFCRFHSGHPVIACRADAEFIFSVFVFGTHHCLSLTFTKADFIVSFQSKFCIKNNSIALFNNNFVSRRLLYTEGQQGRKWSKNRIIRFIELWKTCNEYRGRNREKNEQYHHIECIINTREKIWNNNSSRKRRKVCFEGETSNDDDLEDEQEMERCLQAMANGEWIKHKSTISKHTHILNFNNSKSINLLFVNSLIESYCCSLS